MNKPIEGLTTIKSPFGPQETSDRLKREMAVAGLTLFASIDHTAGAMEIGAVLRPTELLIFGNARGGTRLMQQNQLIGLDLPLKALIWRDVANVTWISILEPAWLGTRYDIAAPAQPALDHLTAVLHSLIDKTAKGD